MERALSLLSHLIDENSIWLSWVYAAMLLSAPIVIGWMWYLTLCRPQSYVTGESRKGPIITLTLLTVSLVIALLAILFPMAFPNSMFKWMAVISLSGVYGFLVSRARLRILIAYASIMLAIHWLNVGLHDLT